MALGRRSAIALSNPARRWRRHADHELDFWEQWLKTKGFEWPEMYRFRLARDSPLQPELQELLSPLAETELRLLDIGAGPATVLGKTMAGRVLSITATDALAEEYDRLLERHGVEPPVRTLACKGEDLLARFPRRHFHLVYARNCLDHAADPLRIIRNAIQLTRTDGHAVLVHFVREGEHNLYDGLHQWNFDERAGRPLLWRPGKEECDLIDELGTLADVSCARAERQLRIVLKPKG